MRPDLAQPHRPQDHELLLSERRVPWAFGHQAWREEATVSLVQGVKETTARAHDLVHEVSLAPANDLQCGVADSRPVGRSGGTHASRRWATGVDPSATTLRRPRWVADLFGVAWTTLAALAVLAPALRPGVSLGLSSCWPIVV